MKPTQDNFKVSDISEQTKLYCFYHFGYEDLAEMFYPAFMTNLRDRIEDGRKPKWKNPDLALKRWVRESSPAGSMYKASKWEQALKKCKARQCKEEIPVPVPKMKTTPEKQDRRVAMKELKKMIIGMKI